MKNRYVVVLVTVFVSTAISVSGQTFSAKITNKEGKARENIQVDCLIEGINVRTTERIRLTDQDQLTFVTGSGQSKGGMISFNIPTGRLNSLSRQLEDSKRIRVTFSSPDPSLQTVVLDFLLGTENQTVAVVMMERPVYAPPSNNGCQQSRRCFRCR